MAKRVLITTLNKKSPARPSKANARLPALLKQQLQKLPDWPKLRVADWEPVARSFWGLSDNLSSKDKRYW